MKWLTKPVYLRLWWLVLTLLASAGTVAVGLTGLGVLAGIRSDLPLVLVLVLTCGVTALLFCVWAQVRMEENHGDEVRAAEARRHAQYAQASSRLGQILAVVRCFVIARIAALFIWAYIAQGWAALIWLLLPRVR